MHPIICFVRAEDDISHANSVVKDFDGNYLVNAYHACTIYKINGTDGSIVWRLGGRKSDFVMLDNYRLMHMHHVRIRLIDDVKLPAALRARITDRTHLAISILDNAFASITKRAPSAKSSAAIVILLDLVAMTGQVIERYAQPDGMFGAMFGSVQFQPDGGRFIDWGGQRTISQYTQDNELVYHAELADAAMPTLSYRAHKGPWVGRPATKPDIFSYSWTCTWATAMYASWNGATEVKSWRFFGGATSQGPFKLAAIADKDGFETRAVCSFFASYAYVEALQADGSMLGRSDIVSTRVPDPDTALICTKFRCYQDLEWTEAEADYSPNCRSGNSDMSESVFSQFVLV